MGAAAGELGRAGARRVGLAMSDRWHPIRRLAVLLHRKGYHFLRACVLIVLPALPFSAYITVPSMLTRMVGRRRELGTTRRAAGPPGDALHDCHVVEMSLPAVYKNSYRV